MDARAVEIQHWTQRNGFALRLSLFYAAIFLIAGCYMPFLPVWLDGMGMKEWQISVILATPIALRPFFTPAIGIAADHLGRPIAILKVLAWGSMLSCLILPFTHSFLTIFAAIMLYTAFWMSVMPLTETVVLAGVRRGQGQYGRMRLWGSISFVAMTLGGGAAIDLWGSGAALWLFVGAALAVLMAAQWLPGDSPPAEQPATPASPQRIQFPELLILIRAPELWLFLIAASAVQASHAVYYIFGTLHWTAHGISPTIAGTLWAVGVIVEILLFAYAGGLAEKIGPARLILIGAGAAVLRWSVTAFDPPLAVLYLVQMLHGFTFGAAHLGAMNFMRDAVPHRLSASVQAVYASIGLGIMMGLTSLAAGPLYHALKGKAYLAMALLGLAGVVASVLLWRRWTGGELDLIPKEQALAAR